MTLSFAFPDGHPFATGDREFEELRGRCLRREEERRLEVESRGFFRPPYPGASLYLGAEPGTGPLADGAEHWRRMYLSAAQELMDLRCELHALEEDLRWPPEGQAPRMDIRIYDDPAADARARWELQMTREVDRSVLDSLLSPPAT